jgi:hypothetical protein
VLFHLLYGGYVPINFWGEFASAQWYDYLLIIGCGLAVGRGSTKHFRRMRVGALNKKVDLGAEVIGKDCMSRLKGIVAIGGVGYLLRDKLVFIPHKLNFSRENVKILHSDIASIADYKV